MVDLTFKKLTKPSDGVISKVSSTLRDGSQALYVEHNRVCLVGLASLEGKGRAEVTLWKLGLFSLLKGRVTKMNWEGQRPSKHASSFFRPLLQQKSSKNTTLPSRKTDPWNNEKIKKVKTLRSRKLTKSFPNSLVNGV